MGGNIAVTVQNLLTDADATATILVSGSSALVGTQIRAQVQAGTSGDLYQVLFSTGNTNFLNVYEASATLSITDSPAADTLICTLTELKASLRIPDTDTSDDALLMQLIAFSTAYVQHRTARNLFFQTLTEDIYLDDDDSRTETQLWEFPIRQIDSLTFYSRDLSVLDTVTDTTAYAFTPDGRLYLRHSYRFPLEPDFTRVVYRAGYARIPDDLRQASQGAAGVFYRNLGREGLSSERIGDYSWSASNPLRLPTGVMAELADPLIDGVIRRYARTEIMHG